MGMTQMSETSAPTTTLFTGRDILAAENHLRQGSEDEARAIIAGMPNEVVVRLAAYVKVDASDLWAVVRAARTPRLAR